VINQNYPNIEHIIIDGGSTDNTVEIIKKYEKHITWWVSEKDSGQSHAINKGLQKASGEIITWLNSDDSFFPETLNRISNYFNENPSVKLIHGKALLHGEDINDKVVGAPDSNILSRYLAYIPYPQPASFFKKEMIEAIGHLDAELHYGMDYDLLVRAALQFEILKKDEIFAKYRMHENSKSNDGLKFALDWSTVFSKLLRSLPDTETYITKLTDLKIYQPNNDKYEVKKKVSPEKLKLAFLYFLNMQMHYHYKGLKLEMVGNIANCIKDTDDLFYRKEKVNSIMLKSKYLSPKFISFFRNFTQ